MQFTSIHGPNFPGSYVILFLKHWILLLLPDLSTTEHHFCFGPTSAFFLRLFSSSLLLFLGFCDSSVGKESTCNAGDLGSIPGLERFPGEGKDYPLQYPLQYSCLENSTDYNPWGRKESYNWVTFTLLFPSSMLDTFRPGGLVFSVISFCPLLQFMRFLRKYSEVVCHSLLHWITFCQNSLLWPICFRWPCTAWLIASLSYISPFTMTRQWSVRGYVSLTSFNSLSRACRSMADNVVTAYTSENVKVLK